jgi:hypothetical protein
MAGSKNAPARASALFAVARVDNLGLGSIPTITAAALIETLALHQEFRQSSYGFCDPPRLIRGEVAMTE